VILFALDFSASVRHMKTSPCTFPKMKIRTAQNKTKQNKTKQNKTKQNKTKQNKTKQNKTKQKGEEGGLLAKKRRKQKW
jgi:hypothetical protein